MKRVESARLLYLIQYRVTFIHVNVQVKCTHELLIVFVKASWSAIRSSISLPALLVTVVATKAVLLVRIFLLFGVKVHFRLAIFHCIGE